MAKPRSCNSDLKEGMTDGTFKKAVMNRGGFPENITAEVRQQMSGVWHGFREDSSMILPDGRTFHDPHYQDITPVDDENV